MRVRDWWPAVGLFLLFLFGWWLGAGKEQYINQHPNHYHGTPADNPWYNPENITAWATVAAVIVALGGVLVALIQSQRLRDQNETALRASIATEKATEETKRSVDLYMDAERGRMVFERFEWHPGGVSFQVAFRNFGRSMVIVRGLKLFLSGQDAPYMPGGFEEFVRPGKRFLGGFDATRDIRWYPVSKTIRDAVARGGSIDIQIAVLYEAVGGSFFEMNHDIITEVVDGEWTTRNVISTDYRLSRGLAIELLSDPEAFGYFERLNKELREHDKTE